MKIIETPQYGPMFRFTDASVYWTLHVLSDGKRIGRKRLADMIGVGEGSMRRILRELEEQELIQIKQTGITLTKAGNTFLAELPISVIDLDIGDLTIGKHHQAIVVWGVADKIHNGMQQRDTGVRNGALGCTTIVIRDGVLTMPPDWDIDAHSPELAANIRSKSGITEADAIIVGCDDDYHVAVNAAIMAAFELI